MKPETLECIQRLKTAPEVHTFEEATALIEALGLKWRVNTEVGEEDRKGRYAYAIIDYDRTTKETWMVIWMERCLAPRHRHLPGGLYGELNRVLAGHLTDACPITPGSEAMLQYQLSRGEFAIHEEDTEHAPRTDTHCLVLTHHPRGVELLA